MNAIDFPQANRTLTPPAGRDDVYNLKVWTDGERCLSAWRPTEEEKALIMSGAPIFLWVISGGTQPPVALTVGSPFQDDNLNSADAAALNELGISAQMRRSPRAARPAGKTFDAIMPECGATAEERTACLEYLAFLRFRELLMRPECLRFALTALLLPVLE